MDWAALPAWAPYLLAAGLMLGLAAWLVARDRANPVHLAFGGFLVFRALTMVLAAMRGASATPGEERAYLDAAPYAFLPVVPLAVWFACLYPRRRGPLGTRAGGLLVLGLVVALDVAYAVEPRTLWALAPRGEGDVFRAVSPSFALAGYGPLYLALSALHLVLALLALRFALDWARAPPEVPSYSLFLVYAGFALNALFDGTLNALAVARMLAAGDAFPWAPFGWSAVALPPLALVPALLSLAVVARAGRRSADAARRAYARRLLLAAPLPVLSAALLAWTGGAVAVLPGEVGAFVLGLWRLALPLLVTYALLRHKLFDLDVKVRLALKGSTIAAVFVAVFFTVSEVAQTFLSSELGPYVGVVATGILVLCLHPLQNVAERLAQRALPHARPVAQLSEAEKAALYREQLYLAWQDGAIRPKERLMLESLRERLGLPIEVASRLEVEAARVVVQGGAAETPA